MFSRGFATRAGQCCYKTLGLRPGASKKEVKTAFVGLSKKHHPDINRSSTGEDFIAISEAYGVLSDDVKREYYDRMRGVAATSNSALYNGQAGAWEPYPHYSKHVKVDRAQHYKVILWLIGMMVLGSVVHAYRIHSAHKQLQEKSLEETRKNNDVYLQVRERARTSSVQQQLHRLATSHTPK